MADKRTTKQSPATAGPDDAVGNGEQEAFRVWMSFLFPSYDLASWDSWLADRIERGEKVGDAPRHRADLYAAHLARDHDRMTDKLELMWRTSTMVNAKSVALAGDAAKKQRNKAATSAAVQRTATAAEIRKLVLGLAANVPERIKSQGKAPTARAVRALAAKLNPQTEAAERVAAFTERHLVTLINGK